MIRPSEEVLARRVSLYQYTHICISLQRLIAIAPPPGYVRAMRTAAIELVVNGTRRAIASEGEASLLSVLRDEIGLTGAKYGCGEGQCGACTVLIDGVPRRSCITKVWSVAGKAITTIEGIERDGALHPLQEAFLVEDALQCGYCTSGMIVSGVGLLKTNPHPSDAEILEFMEGNICRCGTYPRILAAIRRAAAGNGGVR
jgi:aerobic-type carbon monoxide dehydrogenase small subunit (CoxS/CutS family)